MRHSWPVCLALVVATALFAGLFGCGTVYERGSPILGYPALKRYDRKIITRPDGSRLECYLSLPTDDQPAPLVFICPGSGCFSLFERLDSGEMFDRNAWFWELSGFTDRVRIAFVEKRGAPFGSALLDPDEDEIPFEFLLYDRLENRVNDLLIALEAVMREPGVDADRVAFLGIGQGGLVAAAAAEIYPDVTHVGYLFAGGMSRLEERVLSMREAHAASDNDPAVQEIEMTDFFESIREVMESPDDCETRILNATPAQISSYEFESPVEILLELDCPIFMAVGGADETVPLASADQVRLAFSIHKKDNLTFRVYPDLDHGFINRDLIGKTEASPFRLPNVFDDFCRWFLRK